MDKYIISGSVIVANLNIGQLNTSLLGFWPFTASSVYTGIIIVILIGHLNLNELLHWRLGLIVLMSCIVCLVSNNVLLWYKSVRGNHQASRRLLIAGYLYCLRRIMSKSDWEESRQRLTK